MLAVVFKRKYEDPDGLLYQGGQIVELNDALARYLVAAGVVEVRVPAPGPTEVKGAS
jgi:hypothetical protein